MMSSGGAEGDLPLRWKLRADIQSYQHDDGSAVLKDPLAGKYIQLAGHEFAALQLLESCDRISDWHRRLTRIYPVSGFTIDDLRQFLMRLSRHQLLQSDAAAVISSGHSSTTPAAARWRRLITGCLRFRVPLAKPQRFAQSVTDRLGFLFTPAVGIPYVAILVLAVAIVGIRFSEFRSQLPTMSMLLSLSGLPYLIGMYILVKSLHELGHIVACTHYGATVRDCGFLFLFFTPVLYTNVSDSWILPRAQRMIISSAGILVELGLAAVFALLWWVAEDGPFRYLLMNGVLLCTVSTVLFNGNPLLKFDGYFLLADFLRIPNLYQRAISALQEFLRTLWYESLPDAVHTVTDRRILGFGVLICLYRIFLCAGLCAVAGTAMSGMGLTFLDLPVRAFLLLVIAVLPLTIFTTSTVRQARASQSVTRMALRTALLGGIIWLLLSIPYSDTICVPCVFVPDGTPVYAELSGRLINGRHYGEQVETGSQIALLANDDLEDQLAIADADFREKTLRRDSLRRLGLDLSSELLPTAVESAAASERQLAVLREQIARLQVIAPRSGILLPPESVFQTPVDLRMTRWEGTPLDRRNYGATLERGQLLGYLAEADTRRLMAITDEEQADQIRDGHDAAVLYLSGDRPDYPIEAMEISQMETQGLPQCLLTLPDNQWVIAAGGITRYAVPCISGRIHAADGQLPPLYSTGLLKVRGKSVTLGARLIRVLRRSIFRAWV